MSRLLFAAARGARIEKTNADGEWRPTWEVFLFDTSESYFSWRIHPDDLHLQYGPISTVLREMVIDGNIYKSVEIGMWNCMALPDIARITVHCHSDSELHRSLFLLILAEALADEGL